MAHRSHGDDFASLDFIQGHETGVAEADHQLAPHGYATTGAAAREISVNSGTKYLNVTRLETVKINVNGKSVTWSFDTLGTRAFPLSNIVPGAEGVTVYVAENPYYRS